MHTSSKGTGFGVWVAIIIIVAVLATYGGYYYGLHAGLQQSPPTLPPSIRIGVVMSNVTYADDLLNGIWLAAKMINDGGGVASRNLTVLIRYTGGNPETAKSMVTSLINEGVRVFVGALLDPEVKAILPMLRENKAILMLISKETYDDVYDDPVVIKMLGGPDVEALAMVDLALEIGKRAAIIAVNDSYGSRLANAINRTYSSRGGVVVYELLYSEASNVAADLERLKDLDLPAVTFLIGYMDDAYVILANASRLKLNTTWILSSTLAHEGLLDHEVAQYLEGSYVVVRRALVRDPQLQNFLELYIKTYNKVPNEVAAYGFDSLKLAALSIAWAGLYDGQTIRKALDNVVSTFSGATGRKLLDLNGNVIQDYEILKIVKVDGDYGFKSVGYWVPISTSKALINWTVKQ